MKILRGVQPGAVTKPPIGGIFSLLLLSSSSSSSSSSLYKSSKLIIVQEEDVGDVGGFMLLNIEVTFPPVEDLVNRRSRRLARVPVACRGSKLSNEYIIEMTNPSKMKTDNPHTTFSVPLRLPF